jgi:hypothetical protein
MYQEIEHPEHYLRLNNSVQPFLLHSLGYVINSEELGGNVSDILKEQGFSLRLKLLLINLQRGNLIQQRPFLYPESD